MNEGLLVMKEVMLMLRQCDATCGVTRLEYSRIDAPLFVDELVGTDDHRVELRVVGFLEATDKAAPARAVDAHRPRVDEHLVDGE